MGFCTLQYADKYFPKVTYGNEYTVALQWLEHLWDHEN